jgi:hypothetical protein
MEYKVIKTFRDVCGSMRLPGESVELGDDRAAKLRFNGVIGQMGRVETMTIPTPEVAIVQKPVETATEKPKEKRRK